MSENGETALNQLSDKFIVIERDDMRKYLNQHDRETLEYLLGRFARAKEKAGEKSNKYIVVHQDEEYADRIAELVVEGEKVKSKCEH